MVLENGEDLEQELQTGIWFGRNIIQICFFNESQEGQGLSDFQEEYISPDFEQSNLKLKNEG